METQPDFALVLTDAESDPSRLQRLTRDFTTALDRQQDLRARIPKQESLPGAKGDPVTLGAIVLTLLGTGGAVKSLIDVLKAYIDRKPSLKIEITRPDGSKVTVSAESMSPKQLEFLHEFLKG